MIDEANEFPITQVDQSLRHVVRHVDDSNLFIARSECLVGKQRVVHDPRLCDRLLRIVQLVLSLDLLTLFVVVDYGCAEHV